MYNVLMPIDRDEDRARAQAEAIADLPGSSEVEVTLLHVFEDADRADTTSPTQIPAGGTVSDVFGEAGISVTTRSEGGDPAAVIVQVAREIDADRIVMGGRKRSPLGSLLFGSVSQAVILDTTRPVTITGAASG